MNIIEVKTVIDKCTRKGKRKDGTPYTKLFFIGVMEDGEERGISTFHHVDEGEMYEMELASHDYQDKTYWEATTVKKWEEPKPGGETKEPTKPLPTPEPKPSALPSNTLRETALKCSLIYYDKAQKGISADDVLATAQRFYEWLKQ